MYYCNLSEHKSLRMKRQILFVINPIAGDMDKSALLNKLSKFEEIYDCTAATYLTTGENDEESIKEEINRLTPETVVAVGGDGTINMLSPILIEKKVQLGIIPMGSANGMAAELGIPLDIDQALAVIFRGSLMDIDVIYINKKYHALHLSDLGLNAQLIQLYESEQRRGWWGYAKNLFKAFRMAKSYRFHLTIDNKTWLERGTMLAFANGRMYGYGGILNPEGQFDDGEFEVCVIRRLSVWRALLLLIPMYTGKLHKTDILSVYRCSKAHVKASRRLPFQIDGEWVADTDECQAEILASALSIWTPQNPS